MDPPKLPFANDGSFMEQFMKLQQQKQAETQAEPGPSDHTAPAGASATPEAAETASDSADVGPGPSGRAGSVPPVDSTGPSGDDDFIASPTWAGAKAGYVFKVDSLGCGYYRDVPLAERMQVSGATGSGCTTGTPKITVRQ